MQSKCAGLIGIVVVSLMVMSCKSETMSAQEQTVLNSLKAVQNTVEANAPLEKYLASVEAAKAQIERLKASNQAKPCFLNAAQKCHASYEIAGKAWQRKTVEKDPKRKADMDMTMSFSLSFAAIEMEKASQCFHK
jgi:Tfp pilus assembly major pilin PilA